ncbi:hypothetical protein P7K49_014950, partial [Saguinus oedipus]
MESQVLSTPRALAHHEQEAPQHLPVREAETHTLREAWMWGPEARTLPGHWLDHR